MRLSILIALLLTVAGCAGVDPDRLKALPEDTLFSVALPEFASIQPDYRRQVSDNVVTERMGYRPHPGQGFALFTYVMGPPGTFAPSPFDENQAPAALEAAIRSDSLLKGRALSIESKGKAANVYGTAHWISFRMSGYTCAAIGQSFDDRAGLHGFLCSPDSGGEVYTESRIRETVEGIVRRPNKEADAMLSRSGG